MLTLRKYRVLELMSEKYDTQKEFAADLGISRTWLSGLLNGREEPSTEVLVKMCGLLGCNIDDISQYPKPIALPDAMATMDQMLQPT